MEAQEGPTHLSLSPTFSSYSSGSSSLAEIAARVVREVGEEPFADAHNYGWESEGSVYRFRENLSNVHVRESAEGARSNNNDKNGDDDDEFEFAVLREPDASTSSAHEIFYNGQIKPVYPVFNMDLLLDNGSRVDSGLENLKKKPTVRRSPLRKLMNEEERKTTPFSSSGADDLGAVPSETYCVWSPSTEKTSPGRGNKRNSTASSNRWKFRDLLYKSKSEGEDEVVKRKTSIKKDDKPGNVSKGKEDCRSGVAVRITSSTSSNSGFFTSFASQNARYGRNRTLKEGDKRRSYLPYRQHLVGCVADAKATL